MAIEKKKISEKVIDAIRKRLESGALKIGDKLPNQNQLSKEFGVSRTSLREAMNILDLLGVIEQRPGYGTVIRKMIPKQHGEENDLTLLPDSETTWELLLARKKLEPVLSETLASSATAAQKESLAMIIEQMISTIEETDYAKYTALDLDFHVKIADFNSNRFLREAFDPLKRHMHFFIEEHIKFIPSTVHESLLHHLDIYQAIVEKNQDMAFHAMQRHIERIMESYTLYELEMVRHKKM